MNIKNIFHQFPQRVYRLVLTLLWGVLVLYWGTYFWVWESWSEWSISWTYTLWVQWPLSWNVSWSFSWHVFGSWVYAITIDGTWKFWDDHLQFQQMQILNDGLETHFYYWPVQYVSSSHTGLSQLIHQYIRLWDGYEEKRYRFSDATLLLLESTTLLNTIFTISQTHSSTLWGNHWVYTLHSKDTITNWSLHWEINYTKTWLKNILLEKPKKTISGSVFLEAFLGSGTSLLQ
jgi:hypothetical protein